MWHLQWLHWFLHEFVLFVNFASMMFTMFGSHNVICYWMIWFSFTVVYSSHSYVRDIASVLAERLALTWNSICSSIVLVYHNYIYCYHCCGKWRYIYIYVFFSECSHKTCVRVWALLLCRNVLKCWLERRVDCGSYVELSWSDRSPVEVISTTLRLKFMNSSFI